MKIYMSIRAKIANLLIIASMKKCVLWVLLLCAGFPLFAKNSSSYYIYIPPVGGLGKSPEDNAFFASLLAGEVAANSYMVSEDQDKANYILTPELSRIPGQRQSDQLYLLRVTLTDIKTNSVITEQDLIYSSPEEAESLLKVMLGNVFSVITAIHEDKNAWRDKWLYLGASAFWSPRIYQGSNQTAKMQNFGGSISAELQFMDFLSVETGVVLIPEWIGILYAKGVNNLDWILEIPLLLKYIFKPGTYHLIEPYGGIHANIPLSGVGSPPLISLCAGVQYGIKAGPGVFFLDARFSTDVGNYRFNKTADNTVSYSNRYQIDIGLGYKFGLFPR